MFTGIILATGRVISLEESGGDLVLGIDAAAIDGNTGAARVFRAEPDRLDVLALDGSV